MNERRFDRLSGRWTVIAENRLFQGTGGPVALPRLRGRCPFCPGNEADTGAATERFPVGAPWRVRAIKNAFPFVSPGAAVVERGPSGERPADFVEACGDQELVVDHPDHDTDLGAFDASHAEAWIAVVMSRVTALGRSSRYATFFRNRGLRSGSSQPHPHTQVVGLGWTPAEAQWRTRLARTHLWSCRRPLVQSVLEDELRDGRRVLFAGEHVVSLCPVAPARAYEIRLLPRAPGDVTALATAGLAELGRLICDGVRRLSRVGVGDYNIVLRRTMPPAASWHVEILPSRRGEGGAELATGIWVVSVSPETAAHRLATELRHPRA